MADVATGTALGLLAALGVGARLGGFATVVRVIGRWIRDGGRLIALGVGSREGPWQTR